MARTARAAVGGVVINRGNCRMRIFSKFGDFAAFEKLLREGRGRVPGMRVLGYCLMDNHWHLVLWPTNDSDLAKFVGWVSTTHVRRWRAHRDSVGEGHLYQGRFKSFPIQRDEHLLRVLRYVEANPVRACKVKRSRDWAFSSLAARAGPSNAVDGKTGNVYAQHDATWLHPWPVDRPGNWEAEVDRAQDRATLDAIRVSIGRGRPFGSPRWVGRIAKALRLDHTLRDPWRPKKQKPVGRKV